MKRPIIALDFPSKKEVFTFLDHFPKEEELFLKIGMELFYKEGPSIVEELIGFGHDIFLDLKLHDIPNTVQSAMRNMAQLGVSIVNVHAAGGEKMMEAAVKGIEEGTPVGQKKPLLIAVTQLTSTSEEQMNKEQLIPISLIESVVQYAKLAEQSGLDGVVCSALEVKKIRNNTSKAFVCLTPGIRLDTNPTDDQKRIVTPKTAKEIGSTYIVVGRPITQAKEPYERYKHIKQEWNGDNRETDC